MGAIDILVDSVQSLYTSLYGSVPPYFFNAVVLFLFAIFIAVITYGIWRFYKTLSKRNFISLNLGKYNISTHPQSRKFFAVLFYFLEYLFIMPVLITIWFAMLSIVILVIASDRTAGQILMLSAALVMAIRILAYSKEELSEELAKLFPFITLAAFLSAPGTISNFNSLNKLREIPLLFDSIVYFLVIVIIFEIILRVLYTLFDLAIGEERINKDEK